MSDEIVLKVGGKAFGGWTSAQVEKSLYQITGAFGFAATDIFPGIFNKWGFSLGDACTVEINGQTIITGYIEDLPISYDSSSHNIQIGGRDKTGDLVDCSFIETPNEWKKQTVANIIKILCEPFDIDVTIDDSVVTQVNAKIPEFKANEGDVVFDLVLKLCKMKGILPVSYGDGKLVLTRAGTTRANDTLELGRNIKSGSTEQSNKDRFKTYIVKGQGVGTDKKTSRDTSEPVGRQTDDVIARYRPIIIFTETPCDAGSCLERARWEAANRAGRSRSLEYEIQGWVQSNGDVWPLNSLVRVKDHFLGIDATLLIATVIFSMSNESGAITKLFVVAPETFDVLPVTTVRTKADINYWD